MTSSMYFVAAGGVSQPMASQENPAPVVAEGKKKSFIPSWSRKGSQQSSDNYGSEASGSPPSFVSCHYVLRWLLSTKKCIKRIHDATLMGNLVSHLWLRMFRGYSYRYVRSHKCFDSWFWCALR